MSTKKVKQYSQQYLQSLEFDINKEAHTKTVMYMASNPDAVFDKVFLVYKFDATPEDIIVEGMRGLGSFENLHAYFKRLAKMTHPDKNSHAMANSVFQKVAQAYQAVEPTLKQQDALKAASQAMPTFTQHEHV